MKFLIFSFLVASAYALPGWGTFDMRPIMALPAEPIEGIASLPGEVLPGVMPLPAEPIEGIASLPGEVLPGVMPLPAEPIEGIASLPGEVLPGVMPLPAEIHPGIMPLPVEIHPDAQPLPIEINPEVRPLPIVEEPETKLPLVQIIVNVADPSLVETIYPSAPVVPQIPEDKPSFGVFPLFPEEAMPEIVDHVDTF